MLTQEPGFVMVGGKVLLIYYKRAMCGGYTIHCGSLSSSKKESPNRRRLRLCASQNSLDPILVTICHQKKKKKTIIEEK